MIGVSCATGKILWKTPNTDSLRMSHGSIMPMVLHGKRMYVYNAVGGVCGISAEGDDIGKLMWLTYGMESCNNCSLPSIPGK